MSFTDASPEIERMMARSGAHCCVSFKSSRAVDARKQNAKYAAMVIIAVVGMAVFGSLIYLTTRPVKHNDFDLH